MQSVSRQIEIARFGGGVQVRQGESDAVQLVGGCPAGVVSLIKPPQPSMAKRTDHALIIPRAGTVINVIGGEDLTGAESPRLSTRQFSSESSSNWWTSLWGPRLPGTTTHFWIDLQLRWDLYHAGRAEAEQIESIRPHEVVNTR